MKQSNQLPCKKENLEGDEETATSDDNLIHYDRIGYVISRLGHVASSVLIAVLSGLSYITIVSLSFKLSLDSFSWMSLAFLPFLFCLVTSFLYESMIKDARRSGVLFFCISIALTVILKQVDTTGFALYGRMIRSVCMLFVFLCIYEVWFMKAKLNERIAERKTLIVGCILAIPLIMVINDFQRVEYLAQAVVGIFCCLGVLVRAMLFEMRELRRIWGEKDK